MLRKKDKAGKRESSDRQETEILSRWAIRCLTEEVNLSRDFKAVREPVMGISG